MAASGLAAASATVGSIDSITLEENPEERDGCTIDGVGSDSDPPIEDILSSEIRTSQTDACNLAEDFKEQDPAQIVQTLASQSGGPPSVSAPPQLTAPEALAALMGTQDDVTDEDIQEAQEDLDNLPESLQEPLGHILSAVVEAYDLRQQAFQDLSEDEMETLRTHHPRLTLSAKGESTTPQKPTISVEAQAQDASFEYTDSDASPTVDQERIQELSQRVDTAHLIQAEAMLLDTIHQQLPTLEELNEDPGASPSSHQPTLAVPPFLAVDLNGPTTYHTNYWVSIDLIGDDTYRNNAGGTFIDTDVETFTAPVSVAIDIDGNDEYTRTVTTNPAGLLGPVLAIQGAGFLGVGALVDTAGSDDYTASLTVTPSSGSQPDASFNPFVAAHGGGSLGAGALVDTAGGNQYEAVAKTSGGDAFVTAQGGGLMGLGLLYGNLGHTTYTADATSNPHVVQSTSNFQQSVIGLGQTIAQGAGALGGYGGHVDVSGPDTYAGTSSGGSAVTETQGAGEAGVGVLVDGTGGDNLLAQADVTPELNAWLNFTCPSGFICNLGLDVNVNMGDAVTYAHGQGRLAGLGVLLNNGAIQGSTHTAEAVNEPSGTGTINCSGGGSCSGEVTVDVTGGDAVTQAQGAGDTGAAGALFGSALSDVYELDAMSGATAIADINGASVSVCEASAVTGNADLLGQGGSLFSVLGAMIEPAGDDTYAASQAIGTLVAQECGSGGSVVPGFLSWTGQAAGEPIINLGPANPAGDPGILLDTGGTDTYSATLGTNAANNACWTNSPPGITTFDTAIGIGIDTTPGNVPAGCLPIPPN